VIASLSSGSLLKGLLAALLGLMAGDGRHRPGLGRVALHLRPSDLLGGIKPLLVMVGLFAVSEMLVQIGEPPLGARRRSNARLKLPDGR
jgi:putative tricarboxylic transport membrane protein